MIFHLSPQLPKPIRDRYEIFFKPVLPAADYLARTSSNRKMSRQEIRALLNKTTDFQKETEKVLELTEKKNVRASLEVLIKTLSELRFSLEE